MGDDRVPAAGKGRSPQSSPLIGLRLAKRIDTAKDPVQSADGDRVIDCTVAHSECANLVA